MVNNYKRYLGVSFAYNNGYVRTMISTFIKLAVIDFHVFIFYGLFYRFYVPKPIRAVQLIA
jgi:hypothetical protein